MAGLINPCRSLGAQACSARWRRSIYIHTHRNTHVYIYIHTYLYIYGGLNQPVPFLGCTGVIGAAAQIARTEGVLAFWKGLLPVYCRQAPFNLLNYLIMEKLTHAVLGKSNF